jgi:putative transposase
MKYRPDFPGHFDGIEHARAHRRRFFDYYNTRHRHSGLGLLIPDTVHHGQAATVHAARAAVLSAAYAARPDRFTRPPVPPALPTPAGINQPPAAPEQTTDDTDRTP